MRCFLLKNAQRGKPRFTWEFAKAGSKLYTGPENISVERDDALSRMAAPATPSQGTVPVLKSKPAFA
jgi:hypothetical protein